MKIIAINGSPRKTWNTATMLDYALQGAASVGAETEMIHLYDINYKGCVSCFACKLKNSKTNGLCAYKDDLTSLLEKAKAADVIILGSPVYYDYVTGQMRAFMERLMFPIDTYMKDSETGIRIKFLDKVVPTGLIYTMNAPKDLMPKIGYIDILATNENAMRRLFGYCESIYSNATYQFNDYSRYDVNMFDEKHKVEDREKQFPVDCQNAFDMGVRLTEKVKELQKS